MDHHNVNIGQRIRHYRQLQGITLRLSWRSCRYSLYYNVLITWSIKTETLELLGLVSYSVGK